MYLKNHENPKYEGIGNAPSSYPTLGAILFNIKGLRNPRKTVAEVLIPGVFRDMSIVIPVIKLKINKNQPGISIGKINRNKMYIYG
jgi:hypothetical protein